MNRASEMPKLEIPEDQTITTLYVGNLNDITTEKDLRYVEYFSYNTFCVHTRHIIDK